MQTMPTERRQQTVTIRINREAHRHAKIAAVQDYMTLEAWIAEAITEKAQKTAARFGHHSVAMWEAWIEEARRMRAGEPLPPTIGMTTGDSGDEQPEK